MAMTSAYSCPNCNAALALDPQTQLLTCPYCDSTFTVDEVEEALRRKSEAHEKAAQSESAAEQATGDASEGVDSREWGKFKAAYEVERFEDVSVYTCVNCGAEVITDKNTVATACQYCGSSVVADDRLSGGLKPNYVIPFKITKESLPDRLKQFYADRPLLPDHFFDESKFDKVQGMYVPFWLFDGLVDGTVEWDAEDVFTFTDGDENVTETKHFRVVRGGSMKFDLIPVDASERMDDDLMDSIEPFDYEELVEFKPAYLSGFLAERFDKDPEEVLNRATVRMKNSADEVFSESVIHEVKTERSNDVDLVSAQVRYAMLPVYLFNATWEGKSFRYAVNGQTGKVVGEVPTDKRKARMAFLKSFAATFVIAAAASAALFIFGIL